MPKIKTHRGAAKRFRKTTSGRLKREHAFGSHLMAKKSALRKRRLRRADLVSAGDEKKIKKLIPYS